MGRKPRANTNYSRRNKYRSVGRGRRNDILKKKEEDNND